MAKFHTPEAPVAPEWVQHWANSPEGQKARAAYQRECRQKREELLDQHSNEHLRHEKEMGELAEQDAELKAIRDQKFQEFQAAERAWCRVRNQIRDKGMKHDRFNQAIGRQLRELPEDPQWAQVTSKIDQYREDVLKNLEGVPYEGKLEVNEAILRAKRSLNSLDNVDEFWAGLEKTVESTKATWRKRLQEVNRQAAKQAALADEEPQRMAKV